MNKNCKSCGAPRGYHDKKCSYCGSAFELRNKRVVVKQVAGDNSVQIGGVNITGSGNVVGSGNVTIGGDVSGLNVVRIGDDE